MRRVAGRVVAGLAIDEVSAATTVQRVVAVAALQCVIGVGAGDGVVAGAALDDLDVTVDVVALAGVVRLVVLGDREVIAALLSAGAVRDGVLAAAADELVCAAAVHPTGAAEQGVVARTPVQDVVT